MPLKIFSFSLNTETRESVFTGNIELQEALQILQQIVIGWAVLKAKEEGSNAKANKSKS